MMVGSVTENLAELRRASLELATGFERAEKLPRAEQSAALREAAAALIEMRRATDLLIQRVR